MTERHWQNWRLLVESAPGSLSIGFAGAVSAMDLHIKELESGNERLLSTLRDISCCPETTCNACHKAARVIIEGWENAETA